MRWRPGEKSEHVNAREGGRCACRGWSLASGRSLCLPFSPAFSSRSFLSIYPLQLRRHICSHLITFAFPSAPTRLIRWTAALVYIFMDYPSLSSATGAVFRHQRALFPLSGSGGGVGGWGRFLNESWGWRVAP